VIRSTPAVLVSAAPNDESGDLITFGAGDQARVLGVQREDLAEELMEEGFIGILTVAPVDD
jgi:hypothetical protein